MVFMCMRMKKNVLAMMTMLALIFVFSFAKQTFALEKGTIDNPYNIFMVLWRGETEVEKGFKDYFTERGIAVNLHIRNLNRNKKNAAGFIEEANRMKPDLIYTWGTTTTLIMNGRFDEKEENAKNYIQDIPGVFVLVAYPVRAGIVKSDEETGRNLTGVRFLAPIQSQISSINAFLQPENTLKKMGIIYNAKEKNSEINTQLVKEYLADSGIDLIIKPVPVNEDGKVDSALIPQLIKDMKSEKVDFLYIGADSFLARNIDLYSQVALDQKLPTFAATEYPIFNAPIFMALISKYYNVGKLAARQAEEILINEKKARDIPLRKLSDFSLIFNKYSMDYLGYYPSMRMLLNAEIINQN